MVVEGLRKTYKGGTEALKGISFHVRRGEIFGILGPNGAGKSTCLGILGTLVKKTSGEARILGLDVSKESKKVRDRIGFALQEAGVDGLATGIEFLVLQGRLHGLSRHVAKERAERLLKLFELDAAARRRIATYSGGMKRRIDLASAFIHEPPLLFLDEPTEGLDPRSRRTLWETLQSLRRSMGLTVVLTTHYMEEADFLCDRLAIIDQGTIVVEGTPEELKSRLGGQSLVLTYAAEASASVFERAEEALRKEALVRDLKRVDHELVVHVPHAATAAPALLRRLDQRHCPPESLAIKQPTLDDVYLKYTGRTMASAEAKT